MENEDLRRLLAFVIGFAFVTFVTLFVLRGCDAAKDVAVTAIESDEMFNEMFGFTDFDGYIETNMSYVTTTWLIPAWADAARLGMISPEDGKALKGKMDQVNARIKSQ